MKIKNFLEFTHLTESEDKKVYSFDELSPEIQERLIEEEREILSEEDWWHESVIEDFKDDMKEVGINDLEAEFTGFYSQGDGASFTSDDIDSRKLLKSMGVKSSYDLNMGDGESTGNKFFDIISDLAEIGLSEETRITPDNLRISVYRTSSRHSHENTVTANIDVEDEPEGWRDTNGFISKLEEETTRYIREKCKDLYRRLQKEYGSLMSEETIKGNLRDKSFDGEGNEIH
jgi:hypothetical protein